MTLLWQYYIIDVKVLQQYILLSDPYQHIIFIFPKKNLFGKLIIFREGYAAE